MKRKITALCACLALALCLLPLFAQRAEAADLDYIASYDISVTPNTDDGSLDIRVQIEWQVLDEGPVEWVKIGLPNGSIRNETALTANIDRLSYDNSYMYVYFVRGYDDGETILFAYSWTQEYMYNLDGGAVTYDYTPGWFDEARVGQMTLTWTDPDGITASSVSGASGPNPYILERENLSHGERLNISVRYDNWPTALDESGSADYYEPQDDGDSRIVAMISLVIVMVMVFCIVYAITRASDGYRGGFCAPRYVFVNNLWFPAGPDGRPKPGSVGMKRRPAPPSASSRMTSPVRMRSV